MPAVVKRLLAAAAVMLALAAIIAAPPLAEAQPSGKPPLSTAQPAPAAGSGFLDRIWAGIITAQRDLTNAMTGAVKRLKASGSVSATALLAFVSFVYGVLHAVGPGHGKFVISSYALASERTVRRSLLLSAMAAAVQAISAIIIVGAFAIILGATSLEIRATESWLETASWALIAALGAWLLWRQLSALRLSAAHAGHHAHSDHHHESHDHGHAHAAHEHETTITTTISPAGICILPIPACSAVPGRGGRLGRSHSRSASARAPALSRSSCSRCRSACSGRAYSRPSRWRPAPH